MCLCVCVTPGYGVRRSKRAQHPQTRPVGCKLPVDTPRFAGPNIQAGWYSMIPVSVHERSPAHAFVCLCVCVCTHACTKCLGCNCGLALGCIQVIWGKLPHYAVCAPSHVATRVVSMLQSCQTQLTCRTHVRQHPTRSQASSYGNQRSFRESQFPKHTLLGIRLDPHHPYTVPPTGKSEM